MSIPVFRPFIKRKDMDAVLTCLLSDHLGTGTETQLLVEELGIQFGMDGGLALREYPRALSLAIAGLDLPPGSRIAIGALSARLWEEAIRANGHLPVVVDCDEANPALSAASLAAIHAAEPVAAVVLGNELGLSSDMAAIRETGVPVVADVSAVLGWACGETTGEGSELPVRDFGDCLVVGLEAASPVTAGGGVAILTGSAGAKARAIQSCLKELAEALPPEVFLSDMNAALARTQNRELSGFMERRVNIQEIFRRAALRGRHKLLHPGSGPAAVAFSFPLVIQSSTSEVQTYARKKNVETAHAFARSILAGLDQADDFDPRTFPHALSLSLRCLLFPLYPGLSQKEIETIEKVIATLP